MGNTSGTKGKNIPIGKLLIANGLISQDQLDEALRIQSEDNSKLLGDILLEQSYITEKQLMMALESRLRVKFVDLAEQSIRREAVDAINRDFAQKNNLIPIDITDGEITVATSDPMDYFILEEIHNKTGYRVKTVLAAATQIKEAISVHYALDSGEVANTLNSQFVLDDTPTLGAELLNEIENAPIVKFVNTLFSMAAKINATDIHIEPMREKSRIRMRIDGQLSTQMEITAAAHQTLVTRIKIISGMNIAERRIPQDGRLEADVDGRKLDMRCSSIPAAFGEKIVIRLLFGIGSILDVRQLGLNLHDFKLFEKIIKASHGMVLLCGPTGSGKTTTLYSILDRISDDRINTITVEDPIEYKIEGVTQVQVNVKAGLTFANGLRSILRQDPDIIMIGEIRDSETAEIAVRSAVTGHLVLSTVHTNDAASTIMRLVDMGIERYLVASALAGIVAQRLVKKLCPACKTAHTTDASEMELLKITAPAQVYSPKGCVECSYTGYKGRRAIFEILPVTQAVRELIVNGSTTDAIKHFCDENFASSLQKNCAELVLDGTVSVEEMLRVTYVV